VLSRLATADENSVLFVLAPIGNPAVGPGVGVTMMPMLIIQTTVICDTRNGGMASSRESCDQTVQTFPSWTLC